MSPNNRRRTLRCDRAFQCCSYRLCLAFIRHNCDPGLRAKETGASNRECLIWYRRHALKMAFVGLLPLTSFIQRYTLHSLRILELGYGRIVERDMSVFANAHKGNVDFIA